MLNNFCKRLMFLCCLFLFAGNSFAELKYVGMKQMEKGKWENAKEKIDKAFAKHPDDFLNYYSLAKLECYGSTLGNPYFNPDQGYEHMQKAYAIYQSLPFYEKDKIDKNWTREEQERDKYIPSAFGFRIAKASDTEEAWNHFLSIYKVCKTEERTTAIEQRNKLAYDKAVQTNTIESYQAFVDKYPDAPQAKSATKAIESLAWQHTKQSNTEEAYRSFAKNYPKNEHASEAIEKADEMHYIAFTQSGTFDAYEKYITAFSARTKYVERAQKSVFELVKDSADIAYLEKALPLLAKNDADIVRAKIQSLSNPEGQSPEGETQTTETVSAPQATAETPIVQNQYDDSKYIYPTGGKTEICLDDYHYKHKYYFYHLNGKIGLVDDAQHVILPVEYDEVKPVGKYTTYYFIRKDKNWGMINGDGTIMLPVVAKSIKCPEYDVYELTEWDGNFLKIDNSDVMHQTLPAECARLVAKYQTAPYFFINPTTAKTVTVDKYWTSGQFHDGLMPVWDVASKKLGFLNHQGEWAIPYSIPMESPASSGIEVAFSGGYFVLHDNTGSKIRYKVYDKNGKVTYQVPNTTNGVTTDISNFVEGGFAIQRVQNGYDYKAGVKLKYISPTGKEMFPGIFKKTYTTHVNQINEYVRPMKESMVAFPDFHNYNDELWGFFDKNGKIIVSPKYEAVHNFSEGLAAVQMPSNGENALKWGFIDKSGKMVIPARYSNEPSDFTDGYALVQKANKKYVYIDKQGNVVSPEYLDATPFLNGYAFVEEEPISYSKEYSAINRDFLKVRCYLPAHVVASSFKDFIKEELSSSNNPHQEVLPLGVDAQDLITSHGDIIYIWSDREYFVKHCTEHIIHLKYGGYRGLDVFCDKTGTVIFGLIPNEF